MTEQPIKILGSGGSFISGLAFPDLLRLRAIVKKYHMQSFPIESYTDREADRLIEAFGPKLCEERIALGVQAKFIEPRTTVIGAIS